MPHGSFLNAVQQTGSSIYSCRGFFSLYLIRQFEPYIQLSTLCMPLEGDKVSMLTHAYPHKPMRKIKVTIYNHQADSQVYV